MGPRVTFAIDKQNGIQYIFIYCTSIVYRVGRQA